MQIKYKLIIFQNIAVVHGNYIWLSLIYQTEVQNLARIKKHTVPIVEIGYNVKGDIQDIVKYVKGKSQIVDREREGCVFRNTDKNISFKCINPDFLIKNNE